jgi:hypothetical protein
MRLDGREAEALPPSMHKAAGNPRRATRAASNRKMEAMQVDDRGNQAQAGAEPLGAPTFVRTIEPLGHRSAFHLGDARTGVAHPDHGLAFTPKQSKLHTSPFEREFHRVVDQIGDRLEKKIAPSIREAM